MDVSPTVFEILTSKT